MQSIRVAFAGTHSTGKSTLLRYLRANSALRVTAIEGITRSLIAAGVPYGRRADTEFFERYADCQAAAEQAAFAADVDVVVSDRTMLDAVGYAKANCMAPDRVSVPAVTMKFLLRLLEDTVTNYDLFVYFPIEFDMTQDGVREGDTRYRIDVDNAIRELVTARCNHVLRVTGTVHDRVVQVLEAIAPLRQR